jgi:hypothetical protein
MRASNILVFSTCKALQPIDVSAAWTALECFCTSHKLSVVFNLLLIFTLSIHVLYECQHVGNLTPVFILWEHKHLNNHVARFGTDASVVRQFLILKRLIFPLYVQCLGWDQKATKYCKVH